MHDGFLVVLMFVLLFIGCCGEKRPAATINTTTAVLLCVLVCSAIRIPFVHTGIQQSYSSLRVLIVLLAVSTADFFYILPVQTGQLCEFD